MPDVTPARTGGASKGRRLESWGEIAAYLSRDVRTVQRWERNLGLPVHRLDVGKQGTVFAYTAELDQWLRRREKRSEIGDDVDSPSASSFTPSSESLTDPSDGGPIESPGTDGSTDLKLRRRHSKWLFGIGVPALIFGFLYFAGAIPYFNAHYRIPLSGNSKTRLFVRPFANDSGDPSDSIFAEGLTDEINTQLARLDPEHLGVIAPTSSKQLRDKPISDLRDRLNVQFVLEGSVFRDENKVRVIAHLVSADDQTPLWTEQYTDDLTDILRVQDTVAADVARKILARLPSSTVSKPHPPADPDGYRAYLQGRRFWSVRDLPHSVSAFETAILKMPDYAPAHSGLASAYALLGQAPNDFSPATVTAPKARAEARRALALNPNNAEAHCVLANLAVVYDWDFATAEREFAEALRIEPNNPTVHQWLGQYLIVRSRMEEAKSETNKALELDPVSPIFTTALAETYYYARDYDATISDANLTLEQNPNFVLAEFWLGSAYREKSMYAESLTHFKRARDLAPDNPALLMAYGHALSVSGDQSGAQSALADLRNLSRHRYVPSIYLAGIFIGLGRKDDAFTELQNATKERSDRLLYLNVEPIADPLRADPRFQTLRNQLHLN